MMGTINCVYETPCGWCSKWDKMCDRKITPEKKSCVHAWCEDEDLYRDENGRLHKAYTCVKCGATRIDSAW